ncbi:MAG: glycosyltransferase family 4 protein [Chitinophagaceae bacterium]|jgi:glycosyltransferase involved in cell wall biosynthesis|nr:glycosyltransferase family 4 protein [Chitinophagaceae bacterium]
MHILLVNNTRIPALQYGGTERVIWWLGKALVQAGHQVSYMVAPGSHCDFAPVYVFEPEKPFAAQVPMDKGIDLIHLNHMVNEAPPLPFIMTMHGNTNIQFPLYRNTVFVSRNHAARFGSDSFVYNGIDPADYGDPMLDHPRRYVHFLGDAAWRVKNVRGAMRIARLAGVPLHVIGGVRFNVNQGIRLTFDPRIHFHGMQGGEAKNRLLRDSGGMIFPVRWHEPFGLAIVESLYFGCPVFATPYGSLPELVPPTVGLLATAASTLAEAVRNRDSYSRQLCHDWVMDQFTAQHMMRAYVKAYEKVLNGHTLNAREPVLQEVPAEKFLAFDAEE